ncbi:hypothetical protein [Corallococcus sp. EGB]|uniref:hypothetical protein n=1 Tax=Corallococcus sp. EGB TaxID=1521117 RepID=UPI001CBAC827|nr:hypothetical protein [Corallococcus sp. EGB]
MQFTLTDDAPPQLSFAGLFWPMLFLLLWVALPLVLWLRRGPRDGHDVLSLKASSPWTRFSSAREFMAWACVAAAFMGPLLMLLVQVVGDIRWAVSHESEPFPEPWSVETVCCGIVILAACAVVPLVRWSGWGARVAREAMPVRIRLRQRLGDLLGWLGVVVIFAGPVLFGQHIIWGFGSRIGVDEYFQWGPPPSPMELLLGLDRLGYWGLVTIAVFATAGWLLLALWRRMDCSPLDVVKVAVRSSRGFVPAIRDLLSWISVAALCMGPLLLGMKFLIWMDGGLMEHGEQTFIGLEPNSWAWFAAMTLLFALLRVRWLRSASSKWDVLHIA